MKKATSFILILILLISIFERSVFTQKRVSQISMIETGEFHGDEITAKSGERWLGLFPTPDGFALLFTTLIVEAAHDPIVDEKPKVKTGKKVSVSRTRKPVFLLNDASLLRRGAVNAVLTDEKYLGNGGFVDLSMGGKKYHLKVVSADPTPANILMPNSKLVFSSEGMSQIIFSVEEPDDGSWSLLWAGDLDGDGKLDLYMDLHNKYNSSQRRLFLSSHASRGNLVKEVAEFSTVGC